MLLVKAILQQQPIIYAWDGKRLHTAILIVHTCKHCLCASIPLLWVSLCTNYKWVLLKRKINSVLLFRNLKPYLKNILKMYLHIVKSHTSLTLRSMILSKLRGLYSESLRSFDSCNLGFDLLFAEKRVLYLVLHVLRQSSVIGTYRKLMQGEIISKEKLAIPSKSTFTTFRR